MTNPDRPDARPYQRAGVEFLSDHPRALLGDEAGLGKSRQLIEAATGDTLIVAPGMVLDGGTWDDETTRWASDASAFSQAAYTALCARERLPTGGSRPKARTVRRASGKTGVEYTGELKPEYDRRWETLILDEAHYVKGRKASWTQALVPLAKRAEKVFLATGTPIVNWADELFVPLQIMYPEEAKPGGRFGSYWRWADEWFTVGPLMSKDGRRTLATHHVGDLKACAPACLERPAFDPCDHYREFASVNLGDRFLMRMRDDVLKDLPPLVEQQVLCPMTKTQSTLYRKMRDDYLAVSAEGVEVVAWSSGSRETMLDKITTGLPLLDLGKDSSKLERLKWDLASRSRPTLVLAHYRSTVEACAQVARDVGAKVEFVHGGVPRGAERERRVRAFQSGAVDVLVGSLETVSEGLTLVAADMAIFVEKSFKPSRNQQAMRRVHRLGQTRPVTILDYVATMANGARTVDVSKRDRLATKTDRQVRHLTAAQFSALL